MIHQSHIIRKIQSWARSERHNNKDHKNDILNNPARHHDDDQQYEDRGVVCGQGKARATNVFPISPYTSTYTCTSTQLYTYTIHYTHLYPTIHNYTPLKTIIRKDSIILKCTHSYQPVPTFTAIIDHIAYLPIPAKHYMTCSPKDEHLYKN